jgi:signal transduction histidine kinase
MIAGWTGIAEQIDDDMYDWMFQRYPPAPAPPESVVLMIDDPTLNLLGGPRRVRTILAEALERLAPAAPRVVAIDLILADQGHDPEDEKEDARLESAFRNTRGLVLATDWANGVWENPLPRFARWAAAVGHTSADQESADGVTREIPLEEAEARQRHWALSLEAFRLARGATHILESPEDLQLELPAGSPAANPLIPSRYADGRPLRIRYVQNLIPHLSVKQFLDDANLAARLRKKVVFLGVYSNTASRDRVVTPFGEHVSGVEVNAQAYETLARGRFLTDTSNLNVLVLCAGIAATAGLIFVWLSGWAYILGAMLLLTAHVVPFLLFRAGIVFPYFASLSSAWLTVLGAAIYQHFFVRRQLRKSETERSRYQQAMHFVAHEMRTPLTAIQGSSELMGRYNLNDEKRKQMALMINSESKRLARMIQTFLDVERLSDGQMELKKEPFEVQELVESCLNRVRSIAERKSIAIYVDGDLEGALLGDRELMEYAVYNLFTNAVKYSPSNTEVHVASHPDGGQLRLSVRDQGIGMDEKEVRKIFQKFYRTKRAEASGETGSGIGLSIVEQIVTHHGGRIEVTSSPGKGSCFTLVLPAQVRDRKAPAVSS